MTARTHVFIATTQGPVPVTRITREEHDVNSVVCVNGDSQRAGISNLYYDFVGKGTGLIAHLTGHGAWRLDIQSNIEDGQSWKLAVFIAHVLEQQGSLGDGVVQPGERVVWATGRVQFDRSVAAVKNVSRKLATSAELIGSCHDQGIEITGLIPAENIDDVPQDWHATRTTTQTRFPLVSVTKVDEALRAVALADKSAAPADAPAQPGWRIGALVAGALAAAGAIVGAFLYSNPAASVAGAPVEQPAAPAQVPEPPAEHKASTSPSMLIAQKRDPTSDCAAQDITTRSVPLSQDDDGFLVYDAVRFENACSIRLQFATPPAAGVFALALKEASFFDLTNEDGYWAVPLPTKIEEDRAYALIVPFAPITDDQQQSLRQRLERYRGSGLLTPGHLERLLTYHGWNATVFRQRIIVPERT